ncbi:hypothetical protein BD310DRAFT_934670 [Dichomitus squalens]|uniref:Uncharacterized protein n=1 Tax=Dichomitus squalens TaxID=114155 RepID=A0A4Q9PLE0_9APHY|nr:hypothetical protein BD310DRAFT_934670 [Dichomitus squalens]
MVIQIFASDPLSGFVSCQTAEGQHRRLASSSTKASARALDRQGVDFLSIEKRSRMSPRDGAIWGCENVQRSFYLTNPLSRLKLLQDIENLGDHSVISPKTTSDALGPHCRLRTDEAPEPSHVDVMPAFGLMNSQWDTCRVSTTVNIVQHSSGASVLCETIRGG